MNPPQQARAIATRQKILDAAMTNLCEQGWAQTTTTAIAERAGVSQGALYKHFGSKHALMAATAEHLFGALIADFRKAFSESAKDSDHLSAVLRELWAVFLTPQLFAVLELYNAARTDADLRDAMRPVVRAHRANLQEEARMLFPEAAEKNPRFEAALDGIFAAMQGAAMTVYLAPEPSEVGAFVSFLDHVSRREMLPPYGRQDP